MKGSLTLATLVGIVIVAMLANSTAVAALPSDTGKILGIELCPQSVCGAAVFVFEFQETSGRERRGSGWIALKHDPLPGVGDIAYITDGVGALWIGWQRFSVVGVTGCLYGDTSELFEVYLQFDLCNWRAQCTPHEFFGGLSHETLIPMIGGDIGPPTFDDCPFDW